MSHMVTVMLNRVLSLGLFHGVLRKVTIEGPREGGKFAIYLKV